MKKFTNILITQLFFVILLFNIGFTENKENSIHGTVIDKASGEPIENVNVYIANSTWGSSTDKEGYYIIRQIPQGFHELVVSSIGYEYKSTEIDFKENDNLILDFGLNPIIYEAETTLIEGTIPTEWLEDLELFKRYFLGRTDFAEECIIENSEVLNFTRPYDSVLEASAIKPLLITNRALGYTIDCILITFNINGFSNTYSWSIKPKFSELIPEDNDEMAEWEENRIDAFEGSSSHFIMSFCTKSLPENGFDIYKVVKAGQKVSRSDWRRVLVDYDEYIESGYSSGNTILRFENYLHVVYRNEYVSWIGLNYSNLTLDQFGYPMENNAYRVFGEWSNEGVANLLPKNLRIYKK